MNITPFVLLAVFLLVFLLPGRALGGESRIVHCTDMHFISPSLTDCGAYFRKVITAADGKVMLYTFPLMEAFVEEMLTSPPDVLILSGDLTFNGATRSHEDLAVMLMPLRNAGIPVLVLPGNHDLNSRQAASFSGDGFTHVPSPSTEEFIRIWHAFGYDDAASRDNASASYTAKIGDTLYLLVDVNTQEAPGAVHPETLKWVREQLLSAKTDGLPVIAVSHQNLLQHNSLFVDGFRISNADELLALYEEYGVLCNLSGHMHMQHIGESQKGVTEFATSALSVLMCQYAEITLTPEHLRYHTVRTNVSGYARGHGFSDPNLRDFTGYSLSFFASSMLRQAASITKLPEGGKILTWMANVNIGYFSGNMQHVKMDESYMRILQRELPFWYIYFNSIRKDVGKNYNEYERALGRN